MKETRIFSLKKISLRNVLSLGLLFFSCSTAWSTSVHQWTFSKDTVYEWDGKLNPNPPKNKISDTIFVLNNSSQSVALDSAHLEIDSPSGVFNYPMLTMDGGMGGGEALIYGEDLRAQGANNENAIGDTLASHSKSSFYNFSISASVASQSNFAKYGSDTLIARLIFFSGKITDTAYVRGIYQVAQECCITAVRSLSRKNPIDHPEGNQMDVLGRELAPTSNPMRVKFKVFLIR